MLAALFPVLDDNGRVAEKAKRDSMELYCVYKKLGTWSRGCVGSETSLTLAKAMMEEGAGKTGVEHFVFDFALEQVVATSRENDSAIESARG